SGSIDHVLPSEKIAELLVELESRPSLGHREAQKCSPPVGDSAGPDRAVRGRSDLHEDPDAAARLTCPECGGSLIQEDESGTARFTCHVGHAYSPLSLATSQGEMVERALWTALRALEESSALRRTMADRALESGLVGLSQSYKDQAADAELRAV